MESVKEAGEVCESPQHMPGRARTTINFAAVEAAARLFRALGDASRLRLLAHLLEGERCVGKLAELEREALSTISQRLRVLRTEKVIARRRQGKHVKYALADRHITELVTNALAHADEPAEKPEESDQEEFNGEQQ
ncbi:MAG: Transcriptional regulator, ArsR family protein [Bryobacterales bacterium]|jgi:ArsR family transcriptional regulator, lead/cadmium/zinc/bismuth-responsive transcriptional repressor|nr:Transcriptional regulator, ArsR family protein [Bryobacterales bacterium]